MTLRISKHMHRPCERCGKYFEKTGKGQKLCLKCWVKARCPKNKRGYRTVQSPVWNFKKKTAKQKLLEGVIRQNEYRQVAREIGNCPRCLKERDNPKFVMCSFCRAYSRKYSKEHYKRKKKL